MLKFGVKNLVNKKNFSSLIITNIGLRAMCVQLDLEVGCKGLKKKKISSDIYLFWSKQVHIKEHPKK